MALKQYKPTSPGQRGLVLVDKSSLSKDRPMKKLTEGLPQEDVGEAIKDFIEKLISKEISLMQLVL